MNSKTESNLKKLKDNEKKFDICCGSNRQKEEIIFETNGDNSIKINNCIKEIKDNSEQYNLLIEEIKNNNDILIKINKDIFEIN